MLEVFPNNILDCVNKSLKFTQALVQKSLEFFLGDGNINLMLYFSLMLLLAKQGNIFEKRSGKWYLISFLASAIPK